MGKRGKLRRWEDGKKRDSANAVDLKRIINY
jgi:hypothetical protein